MFTLPGILTAFSLSLISTILSEKIWSKDMGALHHIRVAKCQIFYTEQIFSLPNFTPRKARKLRQIKHQEGVNLNRRQLLGNKSWTFYDIILVWRQNFISVAQIYPKKYLILQNCVFSQTFYPNLPIFYTYISAISVTFRNSASRSWQ